MYVWTMLQHIVSINSLLFWDNSLDTPKEKTWVVFSFFTLRFQYMHTMTFFKNTNKMSYLFINPLFDLTAELSVRVCALWMFKQQRFMGGHCVYATNPHRPTRDSNQLKLRRRTVVFWIDCNSLLTATLSCPTK